MGTQVRTVVRVEIACFGGKKIHRPFMYVYIHGIWESKMAPFVCLRVDSA